MQAFDADRYLRIEAGALALAPAIHEVAGHCISAGLRNVFFLGTGGAALLMAPAVRLLERRSGLPVHTAVTAELVLSGHAALGEGSLVVVPSVSGPTKESIAALDHARGKGATILALVGHADTPIGQKADHRLVNFAADDTAPESLYIQSLLLALSLMAHRGEYPAYEQTVAELSGLPQHLVAAKQMFEPEARRLVGQLAKDDWHIITAAGGSWPQAQYFGMCVLEEQQWIRTRPVHAADFFHGTFELVDDRTSVIILHGEDETRPLTMRVEAFANTHAGKVSVIDAASFELPGVSRETRALVSPILLASVLERLTAHLAQARNHPLDTRRYYKKLAY